MQNPVQVVLLQEAAAITAAAGPEQLWLTERAPVWLQHFGGGLPQLAPVTGPLLPGDL